MKKFLCTILFLFLVSSINYTYSAGTHPSRFRNLNFEGGGWVTEIIPAQYKNVSFPSLNQYILYARTDVGGLYRSSNNGENWTNITNYYWYFGQTGISLSPSEMSIQGLAVHPENPNIIVVACGNSMEDASNYAIPYQNIRKSTNGGVNWIPLNTGFMDFTGIVFKGNNNVNEGYEKLGGECIIFSPNKEGDIYPMYAGGAPAVSSYSWLYKSTDEGLTWRRVPNYPENTHTITSIAMKEGSSHIWVGTTGGVYVSTNNGYTWSSLYGGTVFHHVKRILLWGNDANRIAYATYGTLNSNQSQYGIARISYNGNFAFDELTGGFDAGASNEQKTTHFSPIIFPRKTTDGTIDETHLIAGRYGRPIRESHGTIPGDTGTWGGHYQQSGSNTQIIFKFEESGHNLPGHQLSSTIEPFPYTGLNNITQNPHYPSCWYASGGAGAFKSENVTIDNSGYTSFATSRWKYIVSGISMPVVHDISFIRNSAGTKMAAFPIMDWVIGWSSNWGQSYSPLNYDRRQIYANWQNTYMTDASRCLDNPGVQGISYVIGGNADNGKAMIYERSQIGTDVTITRTDNISPIPAIYTDNNRFITDGIMFTTVDYVGPGNNIILGGANRILMLVGQNAGKIVPNSNTLGLFYSDDGGRSVIQSTFSEPSTIMGISTNDRYSQSLLPSAFNNVLGDRSVSQFNLTYDNINHVVYIYFENGGVFKSTNNGSSFSFAGHPTNQQVDYLNEGSIKYHNGKLYLAIKGNPTYAPNYRKGGLFVSSNGGANWLPTGGDFVDATHLEVVKTRIAVFGRRKINNTEEKFRSLYMSSNSGLNWKKLPGNENQTISATIPYIRSLRARPFPYDNELWVATSGQGVVVYSGFTSGTPIIVLDNITINNEYHCNENIEIESGGSLTIEGNIGFYAAKDKKIIVREGGKLIVQGVTFSSLDSSQQWGGIEIENCDSSLTIQNCTFNNATLPIKIINNGSYAYKEKIIKNNVFNCKSNQDFAIYAENVFNILILGNQFNMAGENSSTVGLEIKNIEDYICRNCTPNINIINNTFTNGCASMVLNSYASKLTPVYVYGNTFNGSSANYNIIGRMITGTIKNNRFLGTGTDNPVYLQQCTPDMFGNIIIGSGTTMILNGHSYPNLSPLRTINTYYWSGGQNNLFSSVAGNINIINAGLPLINYGHNQFSKNPDPLYFHIAGVLDSTVESYSAAENAWCSTSGLNPVNYLYTSGNPYVITDFSNNYLCEQLPAIQYTGSVITNIGFGMNDTIFTSSYTNSYIPPDEILYSQANVYISEQLYFYAINSYKNLINTHIESQYLNTSLYEIFDCYQLLDTSSNTTYRDNLYSDLKTFLNDKIQSKNYNSEFIDIAYYIVNMCEVNMDNYNDALTGFEFIAMFHPDAAMRLLASWDYDEVMGLMGQSGAEKEITAEQFREKALAEIEIALQKDSTMRVVSRMFKQQNEEIDNTYANKTKSSNSENTGKNKKDNASKKDNTSKENGKRPNIMQLSKEVRADLMQRAEDNLRGLRAMNTDKKIKKHKEDILLIAGLTAATEKKIETTSLPLSYSLSQNYPNPFNPVTKINYELPGDGKIKLMIYDVLGREIKTLVNEVKQAGKYTVEFNGSNFASGVYFYRIESGKFSDVKRMVLLK